MTRTPPYPVIVPRPSFMETVVNFRGKDYFCSAVGCFGSFLLLDKPGRPAALRVQCGLVSFLGAFTYSYIKSSRRLKGYINNDEEVEELKEYYFKSKKSENLPPS